MTAFHPGQLVMVDIQGKTLDAATAAFLRDNQVRAVCLFRKNLGTEAEVRQLTRDLRAVMGPTALIGLDQEGGSVVRATFLPQAPSAMALGAADDASLAEQVGAGVARGLASIGVNWNFAPVLDINNNPANPVIAERSFSEDADDVTRLAGAWMRGSLKEGVACCVKHFPGHGDTHVDSHLALPTVDKSRAELDALELRPFKALRDEAPAVMTAHIVYPQIDPEHPATLSTKILRDILRVEWGYDGVVITDALMMKAIFERYGYARAAVMAIQAGADMILAQGDLEEQGKSIQALVDAFASGELTAEQGRIACARLDKLALAYPVRHDDYLGAPREADDVLMRKAWAAGLTALRGAAPPALNAALRVFVQPEVPTDGVSEAGPLGQQIVELFSAFPNAQIQYVDDILNLDWAEVPQDGRLNIVASTHRMRYGANAQTWRPDLHLVLWNPFQAHDVPAPTVVTWGYADGALAGLKAWLEGRASATATSPVNLD
ncbi:beta-N-acetylhexosaminidase [Paucibacter sp. B2R-40]|jgi:beta-N-acetylhexosaminidase|uniref:beta-N-acetylhexosaminidase n=1 Tax=Paucibacter sp. B2R-40 TaxID=2893554 RepID=UPI0021E43F28|nr:beta-N-acetylhexosaminidase [Paucibacter sp. B2R-40]MCV2353318.1 beta-N-acetylhexosaminidase [Paucibacter sp. B2R-40]